MENKDLTLVMNIAETNAVLGALGNLPYVQAAPVIEKIKRQAESQLAAQAPEAAEA